jgi:drug/metabolite transporter (DMT)-like permease
MKTLSTAGLIYCSLIWGATFFVVKDALSGVHPVTLVSYRFLIASLLIFPVVAAKKIIRLHLKEGFVLACFLAIGYVTQTWGLAYTTASNSGFITALSVLFVPVILFFLFLKFVSKRQWFTCLIAAVGLWFLTGGIKGLNIGDGLTLLCAPAFAFQLVFVDKYVRKKCNLLSLAFHQFWITGVLCLLISAVFGYSLEITQLKSGQMIFFLAVFPTFSAFFIQLWAQKRVEPVKVALILALEPVFAAVFAWTLGGEVLKLKSIFGGAVIMAAILISELSRFTKSRIKPKTALVKQEN